MFDIPTDGPVFQKRHKNKNWVFFLLKAKVTYVDAVESGLTAVYMSEYDDAGDIFRVRVGNLPAKMAAKLTFSYVQELALSCDQTGTFMLPMVLNPRYTPDCSKVFSLINLRY